jgi:hypothetical protein
VENGRHGAVVTTQPAVPVVYNEAPTISDGDHRGFCLLKLLTHSFQFGWAIGTGPAGMIWRLDFVYDLPGKPFIQVSLCLGEHLRTTSVPSPVNPE